MLQISQDLINLIKQHEGLRLKAYDDLQPNKAISKASDVKGTLTIGYGHTKGVYIGQTITKEQAEQMLLEDLQPFVQTVVESVKVPINVNMFNALVSLTYNIGSNAFKNSTLLKLLNKNDHNGAANEFTKWVKSGGQVLQGLVSRRNAEKALFLRDMFVLQTIMPSISIVSSVKKNASWILPIILIVVAFLIFKK